MSNTTVRNREAESERSAPTEFAEVADYATILLAKVTQGVEGEPSSPALEMPAVVPQVDIFASADNGVDWRVNAYIDRDRLTSDDCANIARALIQAGRQARILNGARAVTIQGSLFRSRTQAGILVRRIEASGHISWSIEPFGFRWPREQWGDNQVRFQSFGAWERVEDHVADGAAHVLLIEVAP